VDKGKKRSNRETKKPKAATRKTAAETVAARFQAWAKPPSPKNKGK